MFNAGNNQSFDDKDRKKSALLHTVITSRMWESVKSHGMPPRFNWFRWETRSFDKDSGFPFFAITLMFRRVWLIFSICSRCMAKPRKNKDSILRLLPSHNGILITGSFQQHFPLPAIWTTERKRNAVQFLEIAWSPRVDVAISSRFSRPPNLFVQIHSFWEIFKDVTFGQHLENSSAISSPSDF